MTNFCAHCGNKLCRANTSGLCQQCVIKARREAKIAIWLESGDTGMGVDTTIRGVIREYILESQKHCCAICGTPDTWNNKKLNFVLDHIDGNAADSSPKNVRLICPNCDSQLDTYKSKNKNSARTLRKEFLKQFRS
jgi:hypothetical protein